MNFIVAVDLDYGIAKNGSLLARLPGDLRFFKQKTLGNVVVMGRKTLESLPGQKPLAERENLVLTKDKNYHCPGATVLHSREEVLKWIKDHNISQEKVFISGGAEIYQLFMPDCCTGYVTEIKHHLAADRFIEKINQSSQWIETGRSQMQQENGYGYEWVTYQRKHRI